MWSGRAVAENKTTRCVNPLNPQALAPEAHLLQYTIFPLYARVVPPEGRKTCPSESGTRWTRLLGISPLAAVLS
jgi:hypothetical protein